MSDDWAWMFAGEVGPFSSRILETSAGLVRMQCGTTSAELALVGADGWVSAADDELRVDRSIPALADALRKVGLPNEEAARLAETTFEAWEAVPRPPQRTRGARARAWVNSISLIALAFASLTWRLLRLLGRESVRVARREPPKESGASRLLGTAEYGVRRIVRSSVGWIEFEFWAEPHGWVGVYDAEGWLRTRADFDPTEQGASGALIAKGVPEDEARKIGAVVIGERLSRIAAATAQ